MRIETRCRHVNAAIGANPLLHYSGQKHLALLLMLSIVTGIMTLVAFPYSSAVLFTPEQAAKIHPELMSKIRILSPESRVIVWLNLEPSVEIGTWLIDEVTSVGATVRILAPEIHALSAEVKTRDLPGLASLPYVVSIEEVLAAVIE